MSAFLAVVDNYRRLLGRPFLKKGSGLTHMRGIAAIILVSGNKQCRRIVDALGDMVIRRVGVKCPKVELIFGSSVFPPPFRRLIEGFVSDHVEQRGNA